MGYDFDKTHEAILESAMMHFAQEGFQRASIRQVCRDAGVTNGAFYAHFDSKDDMFRALVEPTVNGLQEVYAGESASYAEVHSAEEILPVMQQALCSDQTMVHYIYEHADAFRLLLTASSGTSYEDFREKVVQQEKEGTIAFLERCKAYISKPENITGSVVTQISSFVVSTIFDGLLAGRSEEETIRETQLASEFCLAGLKQILGLNTP